MRIGELAKRSGSSTDTIRYYETIGLLSHPERTASGYRSFSSEDVEQLRFILKARRLGFSLDEIRSVLQSHVHGQVVCDQVIDLLAEKLSAVEAVLKELDGFRREIKRVRDSAVSNHEHLPGIGRVCAIIEESGVRTENETLRIVALHQTTNHAPKPKDH